MLKNELIEKLHIKYPIIQAPMAGGVTTSQLVAEVSKAGGLGMIGAGYMTPSKLREQIREIKLLTSNPFGVNLFVPSEFDFTEEEVQYASQKMQPIHDDFQIQLSFDFPTETQLFETFSEQIQVVIEEQVPICSFTFGVPKEDVILKLKHQNIILMGTATTVREALDNEDRGMDIVIVQGSEAGGHRGNYLGGVQESLIGLMSLIPQVVDSVSIPVIAAGGIMDGRGVMASLCLGAKGVQMGTAFLTCVESGANAVHKEAIFHASEDEIVLTRAFSGKSARGIKNQFISDMQKHESNLPVFPVQNTLTQKMRSASTAQSNPAYMSLWSGQSPRLAKVQTVEALMHNIMEEVNKIRSRTLL
ncbi:nitronate monooxygenase [Bacillus sp. 31A1R]|uniref:Probable nitronate monooxygenase n=1 Tax=Robertmurraya mangrovi TaxID=3098077 RepID=A0ABU5J0H2_9BACI|nr:nitronate monooxygenase [Bacillus sp. 31A1R]MDZ5472920.1 nitronate monooxygenase [Bacillus sp. 31A1R]